MESNTANPNSTAISAVSSDQGARLFVYSVWLAMILIALGCIAKYSWNIPLCEDWLLVAPLTGNEPNLFGWLWAQNNEHRTPLPRLILLGLLKVTGDFRVGMYFNVITLGILAFCLIQSARFLRRGRTSFADAFFPIILLHMGNWENLVFNWQVHFVLPVALICGVLLVIICHPTLAAGWAAVFAGSCLISLTLCGAIGLLFVLLLALWLSYCGVLHWFSVKTNSGQRWVGGFLIGSVVISLLLIGLYFIGYERPSWNPPSPSIGTTIKTTAQFLALGFGPIVARFWGLSVMAAFGILVPSALLVGLAVLRHQGLEKQRAWGILLFSSNLVLFALAIGWGRAGLVPILGGLPPRYVHLAVPPFLTAFFVWELYGIPKLRTAFQRGLLVVMCLLLPLNMMVGFQEWGKWYRQGMSAFEQDMLAGTPYNVLAERHRSFLIPWWNENELAGNMQMLQDAGIGPFAYRRSPDS